MGDAPSFFVGNQLLGIRRSDQQPPAASFPDSVQSNAVVLMDVLGNHEQSEPQDRWVPAPLPPSRLFPIGNRGVAPQALKSPSERPGGGQDNAFCPPYAASRSLQFSNPPRKCGIDPIYSDFPFTASAISPIALSMRSTASWGSLTARVCPSFSSHRTAGSFSSLGVSFHLKDPVFPSTSLN